MSKLREKWRQRLWFDLPLTILGLVFMLLGGTFFIFVASVGAPIVPYGGLAIALLGLWLAIIRPLRRAQPETHSEGES